jgi:hypothetical protein
VNAEFKTTVGAGTAVKWPAGIGGKGNEGVAANVQRIKNSIGYVEYAYARELFLSPLRSHPFNRCCCCSHWRMVVFRSAKPLIYFTFIEG